METLKEQSTMTGDEIPLYEDGPPRPNSCATSWKGTTTGFRLPSTAGKLVRHSSTETC